LWNRPEKYPDLKCEKEDLKDCKPFLQNAPCQLLLNYEQVDRMCQDSHKNDYAE
jgi:hypothetical protein